MKRTLLAVLLVLSAAGSFAACSSNDSSTDDSAQPQQAAQYQNLASSYGYDYFGLVCDDYNEGSAFCADDRTFVFCSVGVWWQLDCIDDIGADFCGEDDYYGTVDCYAWTE